MSSVVVIGLKRKIQELEDDAREHKQLQSRTRVLEDKVRKYEMMMPDIQNPLACSVCANDTRDVLPCNHRVCTTCVNRLTSNKHLEMDCPCCRKTYFFNMHNNTTELVHNDFARINTRIGIRTTDTETFRKYMMHYYKELSEWTFRSDTPTPLKRSTSTGCLPF